MDAVVERLKKDLADTKRKLDDLNEKITRLNAERDVLEASERDLQGAVKFYTKSGDSVHARSFTSQPNFQALTIAKAAAVVLRDYENRWLTTREIEQAFEARGRKIRYGTLDIALKGAKDLERKTEDKRNYFRLSEGARSTPK